MLLSPEFQLFNTSHNEIYQEMDHPINEYFVASSHNT